MVRHPRLVMAAGAMAAGSALACHRRCLSQDLPTEQPPPTDGNGRWLVMAAGAMAAGAALAYHQHSLSQDLPPEQTPRTDGNGRWQTNAGGHWKPIERTTSDEVELAYQSWSDGGGRVSTASGELMLDFELWSSAKTTKPEMARPLRRVDRHGRQTHPAPGKLHPYERHLIHRRVKKEQAQAARAGGEASISNEFFWAGFVEANVQHGGASRASLANKMHTFFDFRYNEDWRFAEKKTVKRGGEDFVTPVGYKGFGVRVLGKFDGGDNSWLRMDGGEKEWAVAYHGTSIEGFQGILTGNMHVGPRQLHRGDACTRTGRTVGAGVYCTPHLDVARRYCSAVDVSMTDPNTGQRESKRLVYIMQCRVRPKAIRQPNGNSNYWVINNPEDIRPYKVLVCEVQPWSTW